MSPRLAVVVVAAFLALLAVGYWLTEPAASTEGPADGPAPALRPAPSSKSPPPDGGLPRLTVGERIAVALAAERARATAPPAPLTAPAAEGARADEDVRRAIQAVRPLVDQCFQDAASRYPGPQRVTLSFSVARRGDSGALQEGQVVATSIQDPWLEACFLDAIADARPPAPNGVASVRITYPFQYQPSDAGTPPGRSR